MKVIVSTTIQSPTEATRRFAAMKGWQLIVVGDLRTPHQEYEQLPGCIYLSPSMQEKYDSALSQAIGFSCIQRRNFGFLHAIKELKADIVATVDDDNIPMDGWGENLMVGNIVTVGNYHHTTEPVFDPLSVCGVRYEHLWHRGFPIQLLASRKSDIGEAHALTPDIQADLWNGDPDVDAICRMEHDPKNMRSAAWRFPFASNKPSPFNSQNTFLSAKVIPHYFMMPGIGRADDIWPSYYVQSLGYKVVYGKPSVTQERNAQSLEKNFNDEILMHQQTLNLVKSLSEYTSFDVVAEKRAAFSVFLPERTQQAFNLYQKHFE